MRLCSPLRRAALVAAMALIATVSHAQTPEAGAEVAALLEQGNAAIGAKDFPRAIDAFSRVIALDPTNLEATYDRAVCWLSIGENDSALAGLTAAISIDPTYVNAYLNRGTIYARRDDFARAAEDFTSVITRDSLNLPAIFMRGQVYLQAGRIPESVVDLRNALALEGPSERGEHIAQLLKVMGFAPASGETATFTDDAAKVALELPKEWFRLSNDDGRTLNMFVSEQKVEHDSDLFMVGVTIHRIRRMSTSFEHIQKNGAWLSSYWSGALEEEGRKLAAYRIVSSEKVTVGSYVGVVRLVELRQMPASYPVRMYELVLGGDDEVVTVNMEAPAILFPHYERIFKKALGTFAVAP
jgi:tetratricopeptide (TPR) repeat protein